MRVFLDANILFSASKSDGAVRRLVMDLTGLGHTCCVDAYVTTEAERNLQRHGPSAVAALQTLLERMEVSGALDQSPLNPAWLEWLPEKDRPVLAGAIRLRCDVLLTGDRRDFGSGYGHSFGGVHIHSPRSLFEHLHSL
jgi:hypothetical protein